MRWLPVVAIIFLSACSGPIQPTLAKGDHVTVEHGTTSFRHALQGAANYCTDAQDKAIRHVRTDCPGRRCISTFQCVEH